MNRKDKRKIDELRPVTVKVGVIKEADGSALVSMGKTTAIAAVYGPKTTFPRFMQLSDRAILKTHYTMIPFSTDERVRPGHSRRSQEISKVTRHALEPVIFLEEFPKCTIEVFINILEADAGTRTAGINAASAALADAGIPMRDLVASAAAGKIDKQFVLDLEGKEEDASKCDLPIAYIPRQKKFTLLQMDGDLSPKDVRGVINTAVKGCEIMYEKQKQALREKWESGE
jgi:exosome complex component RRP41